MDKLDSIVMFLQGITPQEAAIKKGKANGGGGAKDPRDWPGQSGGVNETYGRQWFVNSIFVMPFMFPCT